MTHKYQKGVKHVGIAHRAFWFFIFPQNMLLLQIANHHDSAKYLGLKGIKSQFDQGLVTLLKATPHD